MSMKFVVSKPSQQSQITTSKRLNDYILGGRNWNINKGAGYDRIFESMSIGFAAMSNRFRMNSKFHSTDYTKGDVIADTISR